MSETWQPLEDHWDTYYALLLRLMEDGILEDPELASKYAYPDALHLGEGEKEELGRFATERTAEILRLFDAFGTRQKVLGSYFLSAVLMGMVWERERIGR